VAAEEAEATGGDEVTAVSDGAVEPTPQPAATADQEGIAPAPSPVPEDASVVVDEVSPPADAGHEPEQFVGAMAADPGQPPEQPEEASGPGVAMVDEALQSFTRVDRITWRELDQGTEVVVECDGEVDEARVRHSRLDAPPRWALRLLDVESALSEYQFQVQGPRVQRIRVWHHQELDPPQLHVVIDLVGPEVGLEALDVEGNRLVILLSRTGT
jgi:hypothetical protein